MASAVLADFSVSFDPLRDKSYRRTRLGRSVVDFLAWKKIGNTAERTLDQYERDLARGCLMFPDVPLDEFGIEHLSHVAASWPDKSRRVRVAAWREFLKWALLTEKIERNPADKLPPIKRIPKPAIETFTEVEIASLLALPVIDGALMAVLLYTGIRRDEAIHCRLRDVVDEPPPGQLKVIGKGRKERLIPLTLRLASKLEELRVLEGLNPEDHLWYTRRTNRHASSVRRVRPIGVGSFQRWYERAIDEAGVRYRKPHTTRHTFATNYLRGGGGIDRLSRLLGHDSIKTTDDYYSHLDTVDLADEIERVFGVS